MPSELSIWGTGDASTRATMDRIAAEYALPIRACEELEKASIARVEPWSGRAQAKDDPEFTADQILPLEWAKSTKTYRASVSLARMGYGEQAAMLNRSLFEGMAVAHWVHANATEAAERFPAALRFDRYLTRRLLERAGREDDAPEPSVVLKGDELEHMEKRFGEFGGRMWTGHRNLRKLVNSIQDQWSGSGQEMLWKFFEFAHRDNNVLLHSTARGLARAFAEHQEGGGTVWHGPSNVHIGPALFGAHWSYSQTLALMSRHFEFTQPDALQELIDLHQRCYFASLTEEQVRDLGRNDPCPCKSGEKYKNCHLDQMAARRVSP